MSKPKNPTSKGLKRLFIATIVVAVLYFVALFAFAYLAKSAGDADIAGYDAFIKYIFNGIKDMFIFNYENNTNIAYLALSIFLYGLIACWLIFFFVAIAITKKSKRKIIWWGVVLTLVNVLVYMIYAAGSKKSWLIVNNRAPFVDNQSLMVATLAVITLGSLHFVLSIVSYFWSMFESVNNPGASKEEQIESKEYRPNDNQDAYIRGIIKDELEKNQPFGVLITNEKIELVQEVVEKEEAKPLPKPETVKEPEPEPEPEPLPEPEPEPVMMEEAKEEEIIDIPLRVEEPEEEVMMDNPEEYDPLSNLNKKQRDPFMTRIVKADLDIKANYNELKNEILSYGVKSRVARDGDVFRLHKKRYVKIYLVGKTLKVYLALSPEDYKDSPIPVEDVGHKPNYADLPLLFKVRSGLSVRRCKELIKAAMEKDGLTQKETEEVNWVNELRSQHAEKAKDNKNK